MFSLKTFSMFSIKIEGTNFTPFNHSVTFCSPTRQRLPAQGETSLKTKPHKVNPEYISPTPGLSHSDLFFTVYPVPHCWASTSVVCSSSQQKSDSAGGCQAAREMRKEGNSPRQPEIEGKSQASICCLSEPGLINRQLWR